jgi:N-acetylgalactosamine-N,N'-diacetylbacillosaminyl-diphospho-undecaprenol 4-alpha-N-acetylgalactosaminyltransferase
MLSRGGAEKVQARLSFFFEAQGIEVHHIIVQDLVTYEYAGALFNMGKLKNTSNNIQNRLFRLKALKKYLKDHNFDFIIDFRVKNKPFQELVLAKWVYNKPYVMNISSFKTQFYFPKNRSLAKFIYKDAFGFVTVSKAVKEKIEKLFNCKNVQTIYNPINSEALEKSANEALEIDYNFILGIGRMQDNIKQFDHLILAFKNSEAIRHNIKLLLIGDGAYRRELEAFALKEGVEQEVVFESYQENPYPYMKQARLMALTSKNEGFPNVLIESLACGTPLVAYNCESGPDEIISSEYNGLLVKNQDIDAMTEAINRMIKDEELYQFCKSNAKNSVKQFDINAIGKQWLDFLKIPTQL